MASPQSPAASIGSLDNGPPSLEQLVAHFVNAKRSLASIHHVWRANEVVTQARQLLEVDAVLTSKIVFLRRGLEDQTKTLRTLRYGVDLVGVEGHDEFKEMLTSLDESSHHLHNTLHLLKETPIHSTLQPPGTPQKYLFDFIDSSSVDDLEASLRACIDRTNEADSALAETIDAFGASLARLDDAIDTCPPPPDPSPSPLPPSFRQLEGHATETASLLQSLVRHYDLCVTALKHTEGGNEAATRAASDESPLPSSHDLPHDLDPNLHVNLDQLDIDVASLRPDAPPPPPMTEAERADMLAVLANDAAEVDDVVAEIRDRVSDMEALAGEMAGHIEALQASYSAHLQAFRLMADVGKEVPEYLASCRTFQARWGEEKTKIEEGMLALEGLREFYDGFLDAYDGLLVEVDRRRQVRIKMEIIAREALKKIERLHEDDLAARNTFHVMQGEHLPSDIWPGLVDPPPRYDIVVSSDRDAAPSATMTGDKQSRRQAEVEEIERRIRDISIPALPDDVVEGAIRRMEERRA
ncbi:Kinase activator [Lasiodiplodia theobromae]|uniref:Kinase activator n=1 Tax=Lasiodiplodia theobromae TaxID=45133 RepID=UPI0015C352C4|nr:Kinase activator [Lasiodiplodia theobromae]KAF4542661.1 Kinase activator [Lasiodiplodia theobromae]